MLFSDTLIDWYLKNKRDLPWRKTKNPYAVWLSEIMLQQTRVAQAIPYYLKFTESFPTVFELAKAAEQTVLKMWQGLGYYSRARNLHFSAKYIAEELGGNFPSTFSAIKKLKGVGDYTAAAIASICFDKPVAVVDGNVYRVLARYFGIQTPINSTQGGKEFKVLAQSLLDVNNASIYNQAIMEFGALLCKPKNPFCNTCPFIGGCVAYREKQIEILPIKEKKLKIKHRFFNYLVVMTKDDKTVLVQRKEKGIWQGLYQFPLIETQEVIDSNTLIHTDEFRELFPVATAVSLFNKQKIIHKLTHQHLHTHFWIVKIDFLKEATIFWKEIETYPVPVLIANFVSEFNQRQHYYRLQKNDKNKYNV